MADTSLIFNVIARDSGLGRVLDKITSGFRSAGAAAEESLDKAASRTANVDRQLDEARARVKALSEEFERTGDKTIFSKISKDKSLINNLTKIKAELSNTKNETEETGGFLDRLGSIFSSGADKIQGFGSSLVGAGSSASSMLSSVSGLIAAAAGIAVFGTVAAPAIYVFGGALAALPGMISGAVAALAVLKMGMSGLSENWAAMNAPKKTGGGGGGSTPKVDMTPKIRAVQAAQRDVAKSARDVADAQTALKDAELKVAKAHDVAREKLSDLNREWRTAKQDQAEATEGLVEAEQNLRLAQGRGNPGEIMAAQMALDKQRLTVEDAADKTDDLGKEYQDASRKGIEGSDEVTAAKKAEIQANRTLQDSVQNHALAIQRLGDAQKDLAAKTAAAGAAGAAAGAVLPTIASNAQKFLDKLKELKPAFDNLRLDVQQRLFAGLSDKLQTMSTNWLPALKVGLGNMADTINGVVKTAFDSLSDPTFIKNIMVGVDSFRGALGNVGQAVAGPLVDAFGRLARASKPVMDVIGEKIAKIITDFSTWIAKMDNSGGLDRFMAKAAHIIGTVFDILEDVFRIGGEVIGILFGTNLGGTDAWDNLAKAIHGIADYLADPKVQAQISKFINIFGALPFLIGDAMSAMGSIPDKIKAVQKWFQDFPTNVGRFMSALPGVLEKWASAAVSKLGYWIGYGIGWTVKEFFALPGNILKAVKALPGVLSSIGTWIYNAMVWTAEAMVSIGKNIVIGMWNGIVAMAQWLSDKTYKFARGIYQGIQNALGIGSPSKVMAKEVGHWIPAGIALGMDNNRGAVTAAVGRLADDLASTKLPSPTVDMDGTVDSMGSTLTVAARRQRVDVRSVIDVTGQEGKFKTLIRGLVRTDNLNQDKG